MLQLLVSQLLNVTVKPADPLCPRCHERSRHRTALDERLTSYCTPCHQDIKRKAKLKEKQNDTA